MASPETRCTYRAASLFRARNTGRMFTRETRLWRLSATYPSFCCSHLRSGQRAKIVARPRARARSIRPPDPAAANEVEPWARLAGRAPARRRIESTAAASQSLGGSDGTGSSDLRAPYDPPGARSVASARGHAGLEGPRWGAFAAALGARAAAGDPAARRSTVAVCAGVWGTREAEAGLGGGVRAAAAGRRMTSESNSGVRMGWGGGARWRGRRRFDFVARPRAGCGRAGGQRMNGGRGGRDAWRGTEGQVAEGDDGPDRGTDKKEICGGRGRWDGVLTPLSRPAFPPASTPPRTTDDIWSRPSLQLPCLADLSPHAPYPLPLPLPLSALPRPPPYLPLFCPIVPCCCTPLSQPLSDCTAPIQREHSPPIHPQLSCSTQHLAYIAQVFLRLPLALQDAR